MTERRVVLPFIKSQTPCKIVGWLDGDVGEGVYYEELSNKDIARIKLRSFIGGISLVFVVGSCILLVASLI